MITNLLSRVAQVVEEIPGTYVPQDDLETDINNFSIKIVTVAIISLIVLTIIAANTKQFPKLKVPLFSLMALAMMGSTVLMIGATVFLNVKADSKGPVHWHADFEMWACGNELELRDPTGFLSNKIGTSVLHEHDDHRIHLEGVVVEDEIDASIGKFMYVIGGAITDSALVIPLNDEVEKTFEDEFDGDGQSAPAPGLVDQFIVQDGDNGRLARFLNGQNCGEERAEVQTFIYRYDEDTKTYEQSKLGEDVIDFTIYEDPNVPPGDCIIFEFDVPKEKTNKLCEQYGIRDIDRCEQFGVMPEQRSICEIQQLNYDVNTDYRIQNTVEEVLEENAEEIETEEVEIPDNIDSSAEGAE